MKSAWLGVAAVLAFVFVSEGALAQSTTQVIEYYHTDALGSVRAVTKQVNGQWQAVARYDFTPFGEEIVPQVPPPYKRLFTGHERDAETGQDYFGARYFRADIGRFTTVDPELNVNAALLDPQRWNRYAYVRNNPLRYIDPDGRDIWDLLAGMGNAIKSNFTFGVGRETGGNSDFRVGQFAGDLISIPVGLAETVTGGGVGLAGLAAEGPSFGTSTVVVAGGVMVMTQGGTAAIAGAAGAGTFLAKSANDLLGSDGASRETTPTTDRGAFEAVRGTSGKRNKETGEIWVQDKLHKNHYEVYKNKKDFENGRRDRSVWADGRAKYQF
jgi:RHS repeat-associated protein